MNSTQASWPTTQPRLSPRGGLPAEARGASSLRLASAGHVPRYILEPGAERPRRDEPAESAHQLRAAQATLAALQACHARAERREVAWMLGCLAGALILILANLPVLLR